MTPQTLLLYHYQKVSHGNHPVPNLPSEGEFLPWKDRFLSLRCLHLLSHVKQDPTADASMPSGRLETASSWLCCKGEDDSGSLFFPPFSAAQFPKPLTESKTWFGWGWALPRVQWRSGRWRALGKTQVTEWQHAQQCRQGQWSPSLSSGQDKMTQQTKAFSKANSVDLTSSKGNVWAFALLPSV